jgi:hypothetical protein
MEITLISGPDLTCDHKRLWSNLQKSDPLFAGPYFSPEFVSTVASVRDGVFVGLLAEQGEVVGFFPFWRYAAQEAEAVASTYTDFQGVVSSRV